MYGYQCIKCRNFWASQAAPDQGYALITQFCPLCLPTVAGRMPLPDVTRDVVATRRMRPHMLGEVAV